MQGKEYLPVRELRREPMSDVDSKGGLADASHPADRVDADDTTKASRRCGHVYQCPELGLPAGEACDIARQRPGGVDASRRQGATGHEHAADWSTSCCGLELRSRRAGQTECVGQ